MKLIFIGAGNLATQLALACSKQGFEILQVYSRTEASARALAEKVQCGFTTSLSELRDDADLYLFSVKDDALPGLLAAMKPNNGIWAHTAGSIPMSVFDGYTDKQGVFYPLQTFSKSRTVNFRKIPIFIEASSEAVAESLLQIASRLSDQVSLLTSDKRKRLHLAAVFACNFTNHMYVLASKLLQEEHIPIDVLQPLIDETAAKIHDLTPAAAQTGPAVRYDEQVISKQLGMLSDPRMQELYRLLSESIHQEAINKPT